MARVIKRIERKMKSDIKRTAAMIMHDHDSCIERVKNKPYEIIVVDANSTDKTESIASSYINIDIISLKKEPPKGWVGKPWSCWNGYLKSIGDLLLFLDADVELSREALESLVTEYIKHSGLISVWPYQRLEKFYEHLIMPFNLIAISSINAFSLFLQIYSQWGFWTGDLNLKKRLQENWRASCSNESSCLLSFTLFIFLIVFLSSIFKKFILRVVTWKGRKINV